MQAQNELRQVKRNLANLLNDSLISKEPETLLEMIHRKGLKDPKPRPPSYYHSRVRMQACPHKYPDDTVMRHFQSIAKQSPLWTSYYDDDGVSGVVFSSPELTKLYVDEFVRLNHLKG